MLLRRALASLWQIVLPGTALLIALRADRRDGRPDYVLPWIAFAAVLCLAWSVPLRRNARTPSAVPAIPFWIWPWAALAGVLLYRG